MPVAAWCSECDADVWVDQNGRCQNGHPPEALTRMREATPLPAEAMTTEQFAAPAATSGPRSRAGLWVALGCLGFFAITLVPGVLAVAGVSAYLADGPSSGSALRSIITAVEPPPSGPSAAAEAYVAREYPDYRVLDTYSFSHDDAIGLPGSQFLLRSKSETFPVTLLVGVYDGGLTDVPEQQRPEYVESAGFVTDDGFFSASRLTAYVFSEKDLAAMGKAFDAQKPGTSPVISFAVYDSEYRFVTFDIAADAPSNPSFSEGGLDTTHIGQLMQQNGGMPWEFDIKGM